MVVGKDSYVTIEEATEYIEKFYTSTDERRLKWAGLPVDDKEIILRNATARIEMLTFTGIRQTEDQILSFPRTATSQPVVDETVPDQVRWAQIEEALEIVSPTADSETREIRAGAVIGYSIGNLSESFVLSEANDVTAIIASKTAQSMLQRWLGGSFDVR